jgi:uncharacterized protein (DUF1778 family)
MSRADAPTTDQCDFRLDAVQWEAFLAALDSPPKVHASLGAAPERTGIL